MKIKFEKEQIIKNTEKSNLIEIGEYEIWITKSFFNKDIILLKELSYSITNKLTNEKQKLNLKELSELLKDYIVLKEEIKTPQIDLNNLNLQQLTFYEEFNGLYIGIIKDPKTNINNHCFKYNVKWIDKINIENKYKEYIIINYQKDNYFNDIELKDNYIITPYKEIYKHNKDIFKTTW